MSVPSGTFLALCVVLVASLSGRALGGPLLGGSRAQAEGQHAFHRKFFPLDSSNCKLNRGPYVYSIDNWPNDIRRRESRSLEHMIISSYPDLMQGLPVEEDGNGAYGRAVGTTLNELLFVLKTCGPGALRVPEHAPGDGDLSPLPVLALPQRPDKQRHCDVTTPSEEQGSASCLRRPSPSLLTTLAEDGPRVCSQLGRLACYLLDALRTSREQGSSDCPA